MVASQLLLDFRALVTVTRPHLPPNPRPPDPPGQFSLTLAAELADLCREATAGEGHPLVLDREPDCFLAFPSGPTWDLVGIDPGSIGEPHAGPAGGIVFAPLARSFSLPDIPADRRLWIAGHGAGGAHAQLAAASWIRAGVTIGALYTFGAPRLGDHVFAQTLALPHYRIVNNQDPVPDLPPPGPWRHHGTHLLIHDTGQLDRNPTPISRAGLFLRQSAWLVELLSDGLRGGYPRAVWSLFRRVLQDHSLDRYAERLRSAK